MSELQFISSRTNSQQERKRNSALARAHAANHNRRPPAGRSDQRGRARTHDLASRTGSIVTDPRSPSTSIELDPEEDAASTERALVSLHARQRAVPSQPRSLSSGPLGWVDHPDSAATAHHSESASFGLHDAIISDHVR